MIRNTFFGLLFAVVAMVAAPQAATACGGCCTPEPACCPAPTCCPAPVCCTPAPVKVTWCVADPCSCCTYEVSACLPACCEGQTPCLVGWRKGLFGRKVLTYKFECGECVDVVITRTGRTIVR